MNNCYVKCSTGKYRSDSVINSSGSTGIIYLPCFPDEISENISTNWSQQQLIGRSSPIAVYTGTSFRNIQFSFDMHEDMIKKLNTHSLNEIICQLRSCVYPDYDPYRPPISLFRFGKCVYRGVVTNLGITWKKPINPDSGYKLCSVSVTMDEIINKTTPTASEISNTNPYNPFNS